MVESKKEVMRTSESWKCHGSVVLIPNGGFDVRNCPDPESLARRIVACVNACAGVSTEALEKQGGKAIHAMAQRDYLLAALKEADLFIKNGIELGFIKMPHKDTPDRAHKVPGIVSSAIAKCEVQS